MHVRRDQMEGRLTTDFAAEIGNEVSIQLRRLRASVVIRAVQVVLPGFSPHLGVEAVSKDSNLAPAVPSSRNNDPVTIESIGFVLEREGIARRCCHFPRGSHSG